MDAFLRIEFPETGPLLSSYENHYTLKLLPDRRIKLEQKLQIEKLPNAVSILFFSCA